VKLASALAALIALMLCAGLAVAGCGGGPDGAEETVEELFSRAQDGDFEGACDLYSDELIEIDYNGSREACVDDLRGSVEANPEFLDALQVTGSEPGDDGATAVTYTDDPSDENAGGEIEVQEIDGEWQIVEQ
jgi:hypothetical protein